MQLLILRIHSFVLFLFLIIILVLFWIFIPFILVFNTFKIRLHDLFCLSTKIDITLVNEPVEILAIQLMRLETLTGNLSNPIYFPHRDILLHHQRWIGFSLEQMGRIDHLGFRHHRCPRIDSQCLEYLQSVLEAGKGVQEALEFVGVKPVEQFPREGLEADQMLGDAAELGKVSEVLLMQSPAGDVAHVFDAVSQYR